MTPLFTTDTGTMSTTQAARRLGVSRSSVGRYIREGQLRARRHDGRWVLRSRDVDDLMRHRTNT